MSPPGNYSEFANTFRETSMCLSCIKAGVGRNQTSCICELPIYVKNQGAVLLPSPQRLCCVPFKKKKIGTVFLNIKISMVNKGLI